MSSYEWEVCLKRQKRRRERHEAKQELRLELNDPAVTGVDEDCHVVTQDRKGFHLEDRYEYEAKRFPQHIEDVETPITSESPDYGKK